MTPFAINEILENAEHVPGKFPTDAEIDALPSPTASVLQECIDAFLVVNPWCTEDALRSALGVSSAAMQAATSGFCFIPRAQAEAWMDDWTFGAARGGNGTDRAISGLYEFCCRLRPRKKPLHPKFRRGGWK